LATIFEVNLMSLAWSNIGILNYRNLRESGEQYVIDSILPKFVNQTPILFDVGANVGSYTKLLSKQFPNAKVYSFEPNPETFKTLYNDFRKTKNIKIFNIGLSSSLKETIIYSQKSRRQSTLATLYSNIVPEEDTLQLPIKLSMIDSFCEQNQIEVIDFLKIDTEGHEYDVLKGAEGMLKKGGIKIIQFEFNEMNVVARVFLKDFYNLLSNYSFYRLLPDGLYSLNPYRTQYEVFQYQNILCINRDVL